MNLLCCCYFSIQASIQRNIPAFKEAVKINLEVRIDQDTYLSPDMYVPLHVACKMA